MRRRELEMFSTQRMLSMMWWEGRKPTVDNLRVFSLKGFGLYYVLTDGRKQTNKQLMGEDLIKRNMVQFMF